MLSTQYLLTNRNLPDVATDVVTAVEHSGQTGESVSAAGLLVDHHAFRCQARAGGLSAFPCRVR